MNLKQMAIKVRSTVILGKMMLGRSASYVSLINLGMVLFLTLSKLKEIGFITFNLEVLFIPVYVLTFMLLIAFGYIDFYYLRGYQDEVNKLNVLTPLHPLLAEMKEKVDKLYDKEKGGVM